MKNVALILASGTGTRCGLAYPKQFAEINNKSVLQYTVEKFERHPLIDEIYVVTNSEYLNLVKKLTSKYKKVQDVISGGKTRKDSSYNGISRIKYDECNVLIHDGVRPLVTDEIINTCVKALETKSAVCTTIDSVDTVYITDSNSIIKNIPERRYVKRAQTPQCFKLSLIKKAHTLANNDTSCIVTDDCGLIQHYNLAPIYTIDGDINNIKITYPEDIEFAKNKLENG